MPRVPDCEPSLQAFSPGTPGQVPSPQKPRACHRSYSPLGRPLPLCCQVGSSPFFTGFQPGPPRACVVPSSRTQSCLPGPAHTQSPAIGSLPGSSRALPVPLRPHNHLSSSSATVAQGHSTPWLPWQQAGLHTRTLTQRFKGTAPPESPTSQP